MGKLKVSLGINIVIFIFVAVATVFMLLGIQFMGYEPSLSVRGIDAFRFFTVESNVLMGLMALIFAIFEIKVLKGRRKYIPSKIYILKHIFTVAVVLTMVTTAAFLAPTAPNGYFSMFKNSNLFYHFVVPLLSLITFVFFEGTGKIRFRYTFFGVLPMIVYGVFYSINIFSHMEYGRVSIVYDWYGFAQSGTRELIFVIPVIISATYLISYLLWEFNRKFCQKRRSFLNIWTS